VNEFRLIDFSDAGGGRSSLQGLDRTRITLLLATFLSDYVPPAGTGASALSRSPITLDLEGCRQLDISHFLDRDHAMFVAFSRTPGPASLCTKSGGPYTRLVPTESLTLYRAMIPIGSNDSKTFQAVTQE
jgi:hypothetical protein